MFSLVSGLYDSYLAPSQLNILVVGASGSGKTSFLERLKVTDMPKKPPSRRESAEMERVLPVLPLSVGLALEAGGAHREAYEDVQRTSFTRSRSRASSIATSNSNSSVNGTAQTNGNAIAPSQSNGSALSNGKPAGEASSKDASRQAKDNQKQQKQPQPNKRRGIFPLICPAPERYRNAVLSDEEDDDDDSILDLPKGDSDELFDEIVPRRMDLLEVPPNTPQPPTRVRLHSKEFSMDSIDLGGDTPYGQNNFSSTENTKQHIPTASIAMPKLPQLTAQTDSNATVESQSSQKPNVPQHASLLQDSTEEYDLKQKRKMLPFNRIRPTIGSNLAKLELFGANCHFFDVGGRLQDLWERYYNDCDAVIFCWKLVDPVHGEPDDGSDANSFDSDDPEPFDMSRQLELLEHVRASIPDDIPFLVVGHIFGPAKSTVVNRTFDTNMLLPHYHNPTAMALCCASAQTGAGVRHAMTWLVPLARRLQRERLKQQHLRELAAERQRELLERHLPKHADADSDTDTKVEDM